jgi:hypothetical protein
MKRFKAPWSTTLHIISWCSVVLFITLSASAAFILHSRQADAYVVLAIIVPVVVLAGCALYTVRGYTLTADALLVQRLYWDTRIDLAGLQSATVDPKALSWALRKWGNGGLFSFTGYFWTRQIGSFRAFVTNGRHCVVLRYPDRTIVISPDYPAGFVEAVTPGKRQRVA